MTIKKVRRSKDVEIEKKYVARSNKRENVNLMSHALI